MTARHLLLIAATAGSTIAVQTPGLADEPIPRAFRTESPQGSTGSLPPSNSVAHMTAEGETLWIGSGKGVARSTDRGTSWETFFGDPAFGAHGVYAIAVRGDTTWASTGYVQEVNGQDVQTGAGYAYSADRGASWTNVPQTLDATDDSLVAYGANTVKFLPIVVPEQNVTFDIALGDGTVWIASWSSGLRNSTDRGASSESRGASLRQPELDISLRFPRAIRRRPAPEQQLSRVFGHRPGRYHPLGRHGGGVNKSTDGGVSWTRYSTLNQVSSILGNWVIAIGAQRRDSLTSIWTTNWKADLDPGEEFGISVTDDGGRIWRNALHGIRAYAFAFKGDITYVATADGIYRTADGGASWTRSGTIIDPATRQRITSRTFYSVAVIGDTIVAGGADGMARTTDSPSHPFGSSWQVLRTYRPVNTSTTYAYPNPFSPDDEFVRFHYATGDAPAQVTIEVFDFGMNRVRTVIKDAQRNGPGDHDELWNGRDDADNPVANGVYFYRLSVNDDEPVWGKVMVLQ